MRPHKDRRTEIILYGLFPVSYTQLDVYKRQIKEMDRRGFDRSCYYADLQAHTCLLDGFVNQVRKFEKAKAQPSQDTPER